MAKLKINLEAYNDMYIIHKGLKPEMKEALKRAILSDSLIIGNAELGVFGTIFGHATNDYALAFKDQCDLERDVGDRSVIEGLWKDNPDFGLQCAAYLCDIISLEEVVSEFPITPQDTEEEKPAPEEPTSNTAEDCNENKYRARHRALSLEVDSHVDDLVDRFGKKFVKKNFYTIWHMRKQLKKEGVFDN